MVDVLQNHTEAVTQKASQVLISCSDLTAGNSSEHGHGALRPNHPSVFQFGDGLEAIVQFLYFLSTLVSLLLVLVLENFGYFITLNRKIETNSL